MAQHRFTQTHHIIRQGSECCQQPLHHISALFQHPQRSDVCPECEHDCFGLGQSGGHLHTAHAISLVPILLIHCLHALQWKLTHSSKVVQKYSSAAQENIHHHDPTLDLYCFIIKYSDTWPECPTLLLVSIFLQSLIACMCMFFATSLMSGYVSVLVLQECSIDLMDTHVYQHTDYLLYMCPWFLLHNLS